MKILKKVVILVLVCLLPICVASACGPKTCKVTFVQDGQEAIVKTVNYGSDLAAEDIPSPVPVVGYDIVWDRTDFTNIKEDITVTAIATLKTYTITFLQDGQAPITKTVQHGTELTDIPSPAPVVGYNVAWNVDNFANVQGPMTVNAVATAKTFTITYVVSEFAQSKGVELAETTQTVTYDQAFTLFEKPTYMVGDKEYVLVAWLYNNVEFTSGTWTIDGNITLTMANFEPVGSVGEWIS